MPLFCSVFPLEIVPVDLNAIFLKYEKNMGLFLTYMANNGLLDVTTGTVVSTGIVLKHDAKYYVQAASTRQTAINAVLWDDDSSLWVDYNISSVADTPKKASTAASLLPIWAGIVDLYSADSFDTRTHVYEAFMASGLVQEGGVLTTTEESGQQWDAPNAWPPLVWFSIQGMVKLALPQSIDTAVRPCKAIFHSVVRVHTLSRTHIHTHIHIHILCYLYLYL